MSEEVNDFFANVGVNPANKIPFCGVNNTILPVNAHK